MKVTPSVTGSPWPAAAPRVALSSSDPDCSIELKLVPVAAAMVNVALLAGDAVLRRDDVVAGRQHDLGMRLAPDPQRRRHVARIGACRA